MNGSRRPGTDSRTTLGEKSPELARLLGQAYDYWRGRNDPHRSAEWRRDFIFHLTDCVSDVQGLCRLFERPEDYDKEEAGQLIFGFFIHALHHLNAASRVILEPEDLRDPFADLYRWESKASAKNK